METRLLGSTGFQASCIGLGTWQLGADWGKVNPQLSTEILSTSHDLGVSFIDTADVYGDGLSEQTVGQFIAHCDQPVFVATKMGRRVAQDPALYTPQAFAAWNARSRKNLGVDCLDLVQLHCPPTEVLTRRSTWEELQRMVDRGLIKHYGASVETCDQAFIAMENGAQTLQIIFNIFRRNPLERGVLTEACERGVGVVVRVPLASGLLSGKYGIETAFPADDHRNYNRNGEAFDVGETFAGVPYEVGVHAAQEFVSLCEQFGPEGATPAQIALKWVTEFSGVTTVIPGARSVEQARSNAQAANLPNLSTEFHQALVDLYDRRIREHVQTRW